MMNKIKKFFIKIKSLFKKKENPQHALQEKYLKIGPNFSNIGFVSKNKPGKNQKDIFDRIQPGDLVFCKMPISEKALNNIPEGHRARPYLIVQKSDNELYGYACATHPKRVKSYEKHIFVNMVYDEENKKYKDSCVQLDKAFIIPMSHILNFYQELDEFTIIQIARELQVCENIRKKGVLQFSKPIHLLVGDIIFVDNTYYYIRSIKDDKYNVYRFDNNGVKVDTSGFKIKIPTHIDISHPIVLENISITSLIQLSNSKLNEQIRNLENIPKTKEQKNMGYSHIYSVGRLLVNRVTNEKMIYLFTYANQMFGLNYEKYMLRIFQLQQFNLSVYMDTGDFIDEIYLIYAYKSLLKQGIGHKDYFEKRLEIEDVPEKYPYTLEYATGSVLSDFFENEEYIYLYSFGKRRFGLSAGKNKKFMEITTKNLKKVDDILEEKMISYIENAIDSSKGRIKSTLRKVLENYHQASMNIEYDMKFPLGTVFKHNYNECEYMYLFSMENQDFGIDLEDAAQDCYDFEAIQIGNMYEDGELMDEDIKDILMGILDDTIHVKFYTILQEQLKRYQSLD